MCIPIVITSDNGGKSWGGALRGRYKECPIEVWVSIYYQFLLEQISFTPFPEYFVHDFRYISVYKPESTKFTVVQLFKADTRSISVIKEECTAKYNDLMSSNKMPVNVTNEFIKVAPPYFIQEKPEPNVSDRETRDRRLPPPLPPPSKSPKTYILRSPTRRQTESIVKPESPRKSPKHFLEFPEDDPDPKRQKIE
jgi:hypothetical protein